MKAKLSGLLLALPLAACTELHVGPMGPVPVDSGQEQAPAYSANRLQPGFIYNLPAARIAPSASVRIADCPVDEEALKTLKLYNDKPARPVTEVKFAIEGNIAVAQVRGPEIIIDYRALGAFLKTSSVGIERHPNGMLKSVNAAMEDDTPAVIADIAATAGAIALASTGAPQAAALGALATKTVKPPKSMSPYFTAAVVAPPVLKSVSYLTCADATFDLIKKRDALVEARDAATKELEEANAALAKLLLDSGIGFSQEDIRQVRAYRERILQLTAAITRAKEGIETANSKLTLPLVPSIATASLDDILDGKLTFRPDSDLKNPKRLNAFIAAHFTTATAQIAQNLRDDFDGRECTKVADPSCGSVKQVEDLIAKIAVVTPRSSKLAPEAANRPDFTMRLDSMRNAKKRLRPIHPGDGIIYVEPARYDLWLEAPSFPTSPIAPPARQIKKVEAATIPQKGTYLSLPVRAGFGEKVELKASFDTDGSLLTASYGRSGSSAKALSGTMKGLADQYLASRDAIADRKLKLLKAKTDMLTQRKAYEDAQAKLEPVPPAVDPLKEINAEIAMAQAQATLVEANLRIMEATRKLNGGE